MARSPTSPSTFVARRVRLPLLAGFVLLSGTLLLLLLTEGVLRLAGVGHSTAFTVECRVAGRPAWCDNDRFTWQFFPPGAFRLPAAFAIPADKPAGAFRVFVVGESAAEGDPEPAYSFARYLEVMLRERFPAVPFEIINTGIAAVNSHALLPAVRDLARRDGDLFVLYLGNNEVVGPYGAGTVLTGRGTSLPLIRAGVVVNGTRLGQVFGRVARALTGPREPEAWTGMSMFLEQRVAADAPAMTEVYANFRGNLEEIVRAARRAGARVVLSTVAVNLKDSAPFASLHRDGLGPQAVARWEALVSEGDSLERSSRPTDALARYRAADSIDDHHAELQFRLGRVYWALGRFAEARAGYERARDLDALRFRADREINTIVRSVAEGAGPGVELLDAESIFAARSPQGVPGHELFYEHVHLRPRGNYLLARELFPRVMAMLPEAVRRGAPTTEPPTEEATERRLALTDFDRRRVARLAMGWMRQPPFTGQLTQPAEIEALEREVKAVKEDPVAVAAVYRAAIERAPEDRWLQLNFGGFLETYGELAAAEVVYRRALELLPGNYVASDRLASLLARLGRFEESIGLCRALLRRMPYHPTAHMTLGYALAQTGAYDESVAAFERALALHPPYAVDAFTSIGAVRMEQGSYGAAAEAFRTALARDTGGVRRADLLRRLAGAEAKGLGGRPAPPSP